MEFPRIETGTLVVDFETTGLDYWSKDFQVLGVGFAAEGLPAQFIDFRFEPNAVRWLADVMPRVVMAGHHVKFDLHVATALGLPAPRGVYCTMIAEALLDEHRVAYGLDDIAYDRLNRHKLDVGNKAKLAELPPERLAEYGADDAALTLAVMTQQLPELQEQDLCRVFAMEMELLPVLMRMEHAGVRVDLEAAERSIPVLTERIDALQKEINNEAGRPFNVNSTPQIRAAFKPEPLNRWQFRLIDGTLCGTTKNGNPSIDQHVLKEMQHPLAAMIRRQRKLIKTRDTFVMSHILGHADDRGYVHPTINQTKNDADAGTGSGRMSITDPALQQIPARDQDTAEIIRSMFLPDRGQLWICCDYSQVDFRTAAHLIRDDRLYATYEEDPDADFHGIVAGMTGIPRNAQYAGAPNAKQLNLSMAFGAGPGKIAKMLGMPYSIEDWNGRMVLKPGPEARAVQDTYHARFPRMKQFAKEAEAVGRHRGYVKTFTGRRIRFPNGKGAHKAAGLLYQAFAAEIHKQGLIYVDRSLEGTGARMLVPVHDEVNVSGQEENGPVIKEAYCDTGSFKCRVPIRASLGADSNWYLASKK